jgi:LPS-assembly protein
LNYDVLNKALVNTIVGFEYDADCWLGRIVVERLNSSVISSNTQIMFQLELVGFSRLGPNPLQSLRSNIQRYQPLREQTLQPSRFGNYD